MLTGRFWLACVFPNLVDWLRLIDVRFSESLMWLVDFIGFVPRYLDSFVRFCPSYASWGLMELVGFRPSVSCRLPRRLRRFCVRGSEVTEWMPLHLPTHSSLFLFRLFYFSSDAASNQPLTIVLAFTALSYLSYDHGHALHEYPYPPFLFCWFVCLLAF